MPLTTQYVELLSDKDPYLRYDQYRGSDSQEHKAKLAKDAANVEREAAKKEIILDVSTVNLDPEPHWCEAIIVKVSVQQ
jgi:hypothetical protein